MAYKSKGGCAPITAKIKRTTQGGMITQPLLDMGAPVKMKASSPAKQTSAENFKNEMASQAKTAAEKAEALQAAKKKSDIDSYNKGLNQYRSDVSTLGKNKNTAVGSYNPYGGSGGQKTRVASQKNRITAFEKNLYDYDTKNKPDSTKGYTAKEYAMAKASGTYKLKTADTPTTTETTDPTSSGGGSTTTTTTTTTTGDSSKKYKTSMKNFKVGSQARRDEYTRRGWKQDDTTKVARKKADTTTKATTTKDTTANNKKSTNTKNSKATEGKKYDLTNVTGSTGYQIKQKAKEIGGKISNAAKIAKAKKLAADAKRKTLKVAKKQSQADAAIAAGETNKAARKQRAADRKKSKAQKKSQAAKAIQPK